MASKKPETVPQFKAETASPTTDTAVSTDRHGRKCSKRDMRADGNMAQQIGADFDDFVVSLDPSFCFVGTVRYVSCRKLTRAA